MNISIKRDWCRRAYPGYKWQQKVDKMDEKQIEALFISLRKRGKIPV